jgi:hypothetical protein
MISETQVFQKVNNLTKHYQITQSFHFGPFHKTHCIENNGEKRLQNGHLK